MSDQLMQRRRFLSLVAGGTGGLLASRLLAQDALPARKPNILVILADDLGYADLGFQGCTDIPTPAIDSLAANGVRFSRGHVSCPVCSPTRAGLMTGRYQERFGHEFNPGPAQEAGDKEIGLPLSEKTMADCLKSAGYATGLMGKWHLGYKEVYHPMNRGFDEFFGFLGGSHSYVDPLGDSGNPILRGRDPVDEKEYLTDALTREAVDFIGRHREHPFFLYLAYNAVHAPMQASAKYLDRFQGIQAEPRRTHAAMVSAMDDGVGAVLSKLRELGLEEDTLIFFFSDNGGPSTKNGSRNDPLRGNKGDVFEGGIRVPFLMQWKRRLRPGIPFDQPVITLDVLPTAVKAAGGTIPQDRPLDGVDLLPFVTGDRPGSPHEALFWRYGQKRACIEGSSKILKMDEGPWELYDLASDIKETTNLASQKPEVLKRMDQDFEAWNATLAAPLWAGPGAKGALRRGGKKGRKDRKIQ